MDEFYTNINQYSSKAQTGKAEKVPSPDTANTQAILPNYYVNYSPISTTGATLDLINKEYQTGIVKTYEVIQEVIAASKSIATNTESIKTTLTNSVSSINDA